MLQRNDESIDTDDSKKYLSKKKSIFDTDDEEEDNDSLDNLKNVKKKKKTISKVLTKELSQDGNKKPSRPKGATSLQASNRAVAKEKKLAASRNYARGKNYTEEEDYFIARAFISASENNIRGADQSSPTFMADLADRYFVLFRKESANYEDDMRSLRTPSNLFTRWNKHIRPTVHAFLKQYKFFSENPKSGWVENDIMSAAITTFETETKKKFKFRKCVAPLLQYPKFAILLNAKQPPSKETVPDNKEFKVSTATATNKNSVIKFHQTMGSELQRPLGVKSAKQIFKDKLQNPTDTSISMRRLKALEESAIASSKLTEIYERKGEREHMLAMANMCRLAGDMDGFRQQMDELKEYNAGLRTNKSIVSQYASTNDSLTQQTDDTQTMIGTQFTTTVNYGADTKESMDKSMENNDNTKESMDKNDSMEKNENTQATQFTTATNVYRQMDDDIFVDATGDAIGDDISETQDFTTTAIQRLTTTTLLTGDSPNEVRDKATNEMEL